MSFIVPIMALGVAAALIPLAIHLRNRSRFQVVHWGAMHLLESVLRINRRRLRLEQLLLLLIRMAVPAMVALFMARPVLTGWKTLPGDAKRSVILGLDDSYSMEAGGAERSAASKAMAGVNQILGALPKGSDASVVFLAGGAAGRLERPTVDVRGLRLQLGSLARGHGLAAPSRSILAALARFDQMSYADRELVILSDFQRASWGGDEIAELRRCAARIQALPVKPHITLMRCTSDPVDNVSVESLSFSRFTIGAGQKAQIRGVIRNHGRKARAGLRVRLKVDGQERETTEIAVGAGEQAQVLFAHRFEQPGSHYVEVSCDADALAADDSLLAAIPVWDQIPVLLVTGEPSREPLRGETDYLEIALQPFTSGAARTADLIRTRAVEPSALNQAALAGVRVAILANLDSLPPEQTAAVEEFVRSGGGLLIFTGAKLDVGWFNAAMAGSAGGLMPLRLRPPAGSLTDQRRQTSIIGDHFDHEALALFNAPENGTIGGAEIWMWHPVEDAEAVKSNDRLAVLARLASGDPLLVENHAGEGRILFCATACDADWGNLPMRPAYVPFIQQLVTYLASSVYPPRNVELGAELATFLHPSRAGDELTLTLPDGSREKLKATLNGARAVASARADRPGLYVIEGNGIPPAHFAVNTPRAESDLTLLEDREIAELAAVLQADVVSSPAEYQRVQKQRRSGREIWRYLFGAALGLILLEMILEQRFARRAR